MDEGSKILIGIGMLILTQVIIAFRDKLSKGESASTLLILSKIELSETRMMGKMEGLTEGQVDIKKKQNEFDEQLRQRKEESTIKQKRIEDLERDNKDSKEKIVDLSKKFEEFKHNVQMNELKGLTIPNEKFSKT